MAVFPIEKVLIFFVYGLAFFSMGLAILLEIGRVPLLADARVLRPLAVFGVLHGLHEWLEIFLLQSEWFGVSLSGYWSWLRLVLLVLSFVSLVAYGVQVLHPPKKLAAMDAWVGAGLLTLYIAMILWVGAYDRGDNSIWLAKADVIARYILAVPGAFQAFRALRLQASQRRADGLNTLANSLQWASWGFMAYGVTQVIVTPVAFTPANLINTEWFLHITGIPVQLIRALIAVLITASLIRAMQIVGEKRQAELFTAQQERLEALEQLQAELMKRETLRRNLLRHTVIAQEEERSRIARELHDETAQILTAFSLDVATLQYRACDDPEVIAVGKRLQSLSRNLSRGLKRLVHDLRPAQLDDLGLIPALKYLVDESFKSADLHVQLKTQGKQHRRDPLVETVLYRVAQESLTNIVRHAQTKTAELTLTYDQDRADLRVQDHGVGFLVGDRHPTQIGWGIAGMRERVHSVGGEFTLISEPGQGTCIHVIIPVDNSQPKETLENDR